MSAARQPHAFARTDRSRLGLWWWTTDHILLGVARGADDLGVLLSFASSPAAAAPHERRRPVPLRPCVRACSP